VASQWLYKREMSFLAVLDSGRHVHRSGSPPAWSWEQFIVPGLTLGDGSLRRSTEGYPEGCRDLSGNRGPASGSGMHWRSPGVGIRKISGGYLEGLSGRPNIWKVGLFGW